MLRRIFLFVRKNFTKVTSSTAWLISRIWGLLSYPDRKILKFEEEIVERKSFLPSDNSTDIYSKDIWTKEFIALRKEVGLILGSLFAAMSFLSLIGWHPETSFVRDLLLNFRAFFRDIFSTVIEAIGAKVAPLVLDLWTLFLLLSGVFIRAVFIKNSAINDVLQLNTIDNQKGYVYCLLQAALIILAIWLAIEFLLAEWSGSIEKIKYFALFTVPIIFVALARILGFLVFVPFYYLVYQSKATAALRDLSRDRPWKFLGKISATFLLIISLSAIGSIVKDDDVSFALGLAVLILAVAAVFELVILFFSALQVPRVAMAVAVLTSVLIFGDFVLAIAKTL